LNPGNAPVQSWVYRACVIQGTQQIYVAFLWYWGSKLAADSQAGSTQVSLADSNPRLLIGIGLGIAALLWIIGMAIYLGLPDYYRQAPGKVPLFYKSLSRRKIILVYSIEIIFVSYQAHDDIVVFLRGLYSKLLVVCSIRPKLVVSLVQQTCAWVGDHSPCRVFLHLCLGCCALGL
jgi:hypothetical protein